MSEYPVPDNKQYTELRNTFSNLSAVKEILEEVPKKNSDIVSTSKLYSYAVGTLSYPNPELEYLLKNSSSLRVAYYKMISNLAIYSLEIPMAASDDVELLPRSCDGCLIRFEKSQTRDDHWYVIIELSNDVKISPQNIVLIDKDKNCHKYSLPETRRGIIQLLTNEKSDLLQLLKNPNMEVLLS